MYGFTSTDGYNHSDSKALRDGKFCGLMCDEDNQYDLSEDRAKDWIDQLKKEGFF
jgi:flavodoxin I